MKRILITSSDAMMYQFLLRHIRYLAEHGYEVDCGCFAAEGYEGQNYFQRIKRALPQNSHLYKIHTHRSPLSAGNYRGLSELKKMIRDGRYDIVWTNEPVMGFLTRMAAESQRKSGLKVMYIAHGFHFYRGAPAKNWALFYPAERAMARVTDLLVTINRDDYALAQKDFQSTRVAYIHGVGFDGERFASAPEKRREMREKFGIPQDAFLVLSVGELNENKNHRVVIDALSDLARKGNKTVYYLVCGEGDQRENLTRQAEGSPMAGRIMLPGFCENIEEICKAADLYCFPSIREGLSVSLMEAMSCGLPVVCSDIRGNRDLIVAEEGGWLCDSGDASAFAGAIADCLHNREKAKRFGERNRKAVGEFSFDSVCREVFSLIDGLGEQTAEREN